MAGAWLPMQTWWGQGAHMPLLGARGRGRAEGVKGCGLRLPHGCGKHGGDTAEADEGGRNAVALGLLAAQRTRTGLWRHCQGRAAQTSSKRCERVQHKKGRRACAAEKITVCDYGQSPNLARPGATFLRRPSRRSAWRQIPCCRARHRALVNIAASCGRAPVMAGRTRCAPPCARHAPLFLPALRGSGADVGRSFETVV